MVGEALMEIAPWDLGVWLPLMLLLGLAVMAALLAFVFACEKV
jgi:hypothetical protein